MAYNKQNFKSKEKLYAVQLNAMDDQIAKNTEDVEKLKEEGTGGGSGTPGITPHIGENGNWFIGETDTGVRAEGITPHIGENGNWFLGDTDTGVKAQGDDYILTEADKTEIAEEAAALVDAALLNLIGEVE